MAAVILFAAQPGQKDKSAQPDGARAMPLEIWPPMRRNAQKNITLRLYQP
jgi:hypothetical protein